MSIFDDIYADRRWGSVSGPGSSLENTRGLIAKLPRLINRMGIRSVLDIPCGDHNWMYHVMQQLPGVAYTGADIVEDLVYSNRAAYPDTEFLHLDLCSDVLPEADLIIVRDCLVHLPTPKIKAALRHIYQHRFKYLLTTTFPGRGNKADIAEGGWRPLDLEASPFNLSLPEFVLVEGCTEQGGTYRDKSLALWAL